MNVKENEIISQRTKLNSSTHLKIDYLLSIFYIIRYNNNFRIIKHILYFSVIKLISEPILYSIINYVIYND